MDDQWIITNQYCSTIIHSIYRSSILSTRCFPNHFQPSNSRPARQIAPFLLATTGSSTTTKARKQTVWNHDGTNLLGSSPEKAATMSFCHYSIKILLFDPFGGVGIFCMQSLTLTSAQDILNRDDPPRLRAVCLTPWRVTQRQTTHPLTHHQTLTSAATHCKKVRLLSFWDAE